MENERKEREVLESLKVIIDPDLGRDIVSLGFIKELNIDEAAGTVSFAVELTTPACPLKALFKEQCETAVSALPWVKQARVTMTSRRPQRKAQADKPNGTADVSHIIAVSSAKGGVGKSTVAVNLAYALANSGAKVGLLDADIFGPSLPILVRPEDTTLRSAGGLIRPIEHLGVRLMSFGWATGTRQAAIMRGPMVSSVVSQLSLGTDWGTLDYLIVDMPPGTGDIQLTLTQQLDFAGALIVTTPQQLSFADVVRGIEMFATVKVPTLGLVENMSYYRCPSCAELHRPFGRGASARITELYGIAQTFEIPMHEDISRQSDAGLPIVVAQPDGELAQLYVTIAGAIVREISRAAEGIAAPKITYHAGENISVQWPNGRIQSIRPAALRRACKCAGCINEHTGEAILRPQDVPDNITPTLIEKRGNYAVAIDWSDGHDSSIYPYDAIAALAD